MHNDSMCVSINALIYQLMYHCVSISKMFSVMDKSFEMPVL